MAVYPVMPGAPDYSSSGTSKFIPEIYSALLIKKFYPNTVFSKISNTDYEGDIKDQGDTVNIRTRPTIETFRYKKGMVLPVQNPESPYVTLKIDQGEGFSFALDKVDQFQSDLKLMNVWGEDASQQMKQVIDRNVLISLAAAGAKVANSQDTSANVTGYTTAAGPSIDQYTIAKGALVAGGSTIKTANAIPVGTTPGTNFGTAAVACTVANSADIVKQVLLYGRLLDENNAPEDGRFVVLPSIYMQLLKDIGQDFGKAYATGQNIANVLSGTVPKIDRFDIIFSNNIPTCTGTNGTAVIAGVKYATTFATQITESRIIDNPFAFGKMMQGLQIYGFNVIKPQFLITDFWKTA